MWELSKARDVPAEHAQIPVSSSIVEFPTQLSVIRTICLV